MKYIPHGKPGHLCPDGRCKETAAQINSSARSWMLKGQLDQAKKVVVCPYAFKANGSKRGRQKVKAGCPCKRARH